MCGRSPVGIPVHVATTSSVHLTTSTHLTSSVHLTPSVHGSSSVSHATPHRWTSRGSAQAGNGAGAAPAKVSGPGEASPEGRRR